MTMNINSGSSRQQSIPMLEAPDRIPGQPDQVLSPNDYRALTDKSLDSSMLGDAWGLTEEPIETVHKSGFRILAGEYMAAELISYTTGNKRGPRPQLFARYDRALAARGVLREVKVFEVTDGGAYHEVCIAIPREHFKHDLGIRAEFLTYRAEYIKVLEAVRGSSQRQLLALEEQSPAIARFFEEHAAHSSRHLKVHREVSAQPVWSDAEEDENPGKESQSKRAAKNKKKAGKSNRRKQKMENDPSAPNVRGSAKLGEALGGGFGLVDDDE